MKFFLSDTLNKELRTVSQEADELIYNEREREYGSATDNFTDIAKLWSVILGIEVTPKAVLLCMNQLKIAREIQNPKRDNIVDAIGYLGLTEKIQKGR